MPKLGGFGHFNTTLDTFIMLFLMWKLECGDVFHQREIFPVMLFVSNAKPTCTFRAICIMGTLSYTLLSSIIFSK
jgi:hypothetical protein